MATGGPRVSFNIQNKVLYIGVESRGREHRWKLSPNSGDKAAILREIADVLDPPAPRRRSRSITEPEEYYDDDDEEWAEPPAPRRARRPREAPREARTQVRTPYPPLDPDSEFAGRQAASVPFVDHSRGLNPDGTPIQTHLEAEPAVARSHAALSIEAYEKAQAHAGALTGADPVINERPIVEARPRASRRTQGLDSKGLGFLPPSTGVQLREDQQIRHRPKITDPSFYYDDTH